MTILASVKVRDGLVLATDSMTQISAKLPNGQYAVIKAYSNARKLFQIPALPVGVMSWGAGNIGPRSVEGLILDFARQLKNYIKGEPAVQAVAGGLHTFVKEIYDEAHQGSQAEQRPVLGFFVGGYSPNGKFAEEFEFVLPNWPAVKAVRPPDGFGASWRGVVFPFRRLYGGFDPRIPEQLKSLGVSDNVLEQVFGSGKWNLPFVYDGMPLQDALNHAIFILKPTIDTATFEVGPAPTCGGPLQVAVILPDGTWQWVSKPGLTIVERGEE